MSTLAFVDADLAGDRKNRRSQMGVLIFYDKAPIYWYIKWQPTVEISTFEADVHAMKSSIEMVEAKNI